MQRAVDPDLYPGSDIVLGQGTIRQIVRGSAGADAFRITYSNLYGTARHRWRSTGRGSRASLATGRTWTRRGPP